LYVWTRRSDSTCPTCERFYDLIFVYDSYLSAFENAIPREMLVVVFEKLGKEEGNESEMFSVEDYSCEVDSTDEVRRSGSGTYTSQSGLKKENTVTNQHLSPSQSKPSQFKPNTTGHQNNGHQNTRNNNHRLTSFKQVIKADGPKNVVDQLEFEVHVVNKTVSLESSEEITIEEITMTIETTFETTVETTMETTKQSSSFSDDEEVICQGYFETTKTALRELIRSQRLSKCTQCHKSAKSFDSVSGFWVFETDTIECSGCGKLAHDNSVCLYHWQNLVTTQKSDKHVQTLSNISKMSKTSKMSKKDVKNSDESECDLAGGVSDDFTDTTRSTEDWYCDECVAFCHNCGKMKRTEHVKNCEKMSRKRKLEIRAPKVLACLNHVRDNFKKYIWLSFLFTLPVMLLMLRIGQFKTQK